MPIAQHVRLSANRVVFECALSWSHVTPRAMRANWLPAPSVLVKVLARIVIKIYDGVINFAARFAMRRAVGARAILQ